MACDHGGGIAGEEDDRGGDLLRLDETAERRGIQDRALQCGIGKQGFDEGGPDESRRHPVHPDAVRRSFQSPSPREVHESALHGVVGWIRVKPSSR